MKLGLRSVLWMLVLENYYRVHSEVELFYNEGCCHDAKMAMPHLAEEHKDADRTAAAWFGYPSQQISHNVYSS
jgi:hypothetical protein